MIRRQEGFMTILLLSLLPFLLAAGFAFYFFLTYADSHQAFVQTCYKEQIRIQEQIRFSLKSLKALNPRANYLMTMHRASQVQLAAAVASLNAPAAAKAAERVKYFREQRELLDHQQKALINSSNSMIRSQEQLLIFKLSRMARERRPRLMDFASFSVDGFQNKGTKLAVEPDTKDLAPTYSLRKNFEEEQALELRWKMRLGSAHGASNFLKTNNIYAQSCSTTINSKEESWPVVTREVKSLWKLSLR